MSLQQLTALSPLDGRYHQQSKELSPYFSEYGLIRYRVLVEVSYAKALLDLKPFAKLTKTNENLIQDLEDIINQFDQESALSVKTIEKTTNHDVKAVEYYITQQLIEKGYGTEVQNLIHFGLTSEDVNNLAYGLMLKDACNQILRPQLCSILETLQTLINHYQQHSMLSRTHGQSATPTTMGKEFANFYARLRQPVNQLEHFSFLGKLNGAVGNFNAHMIALPEIDWLQFSETFVQSLGLENNAHTNQIEPHDFIAELSHIYSRLNTVLLDLCRDVWHYISLDYFKLKTVQGEVGSSTMPHKVNPIDFENSEGNLGISNALLGHFANKLPISRLQRDLTDSTTLRNLGVGFGHSLLAYKSLLKGLGKLEINAPVLNKDLENRWEVLAEAIQSVMRIENIDSPYEQLKELTRGHDMTEQSIKRFIDKLQIDSKAKERLLALTPSTYTGYASKLCDALFAE
jgi:adenylosuccinate lyase